MLLLSACCIGLSAMAQTLPNAGMETWHTGASGGASPIVIMAPDNWYGADSLIIADGQTYGAILSIPATSWQRQLFQENTIIHGGSSSAKLVTVKQDTLGIFPGIMSNAQANVTISLAGGTPSLGNITYSGGTAAAYHITSASAWVQYTQGGALDSGTMTVNAYGTYLGLDTLVGTGTVKIGPSTSFQQVTANLTYDASGFAVDTVRILFASSAGTHNAIGSTLYVDDVTMTGIPNAVAEVLSAGNVVTVYPNPASDVLHLNATQAGAYTCTLASVSGQVVASKTFDGSSAINIASLAEGIYFYSIIDANGNVAQRGKVNVLR